MPQTRIPSRFPIGTKFIVEARPSGRTQIYRRHLEFPNGRVLRLRDQSATGFVRAGRRGAHHVPARLVMVEGLHKQN
jgi:hypothetical protein